MTEGQRQAIKRNTAESRRLGHEADRAGRAAVDGLRRAAAATRAKTAGQTTPVRRAGSGS